MICIDFTWLDSRPTSSAFVAHFTGLMPMDKRTIIQIFVVLAPTHSGSTIILNVRGLTWAGSRSLECNFLAPHWSLFSWFPSEAAPSHHLEGKTPRAWSHLIHLSQWTSWWGGRKPIKAHHHQLAPASKCKTDGTLLASPSESSIVHVELLWNTWKHIETSYNAVKDVFQWAAPQTPSRSNERLHLEFERSPTTSLAGEKAFGS